MEEQYPADLGKCLVCRLVGGECEDAVCVFKGVFYPPSEDRQNKLGYLIEFFGGIESVLRLFTLPRRTAASVEENRQFVGGLMRIISDYQEDEIMGPYRNFATMATILTEVVSNEEEVPEKYRCLIEECLKFLNPEAQPEAAATNAPEAPEAAATNASEAAEAVTTRRSARLREVAAKKAVTTTTTTAALTKKATRKRAARKTADPPTTTTDTDTDDQDDNDQDDNRDSPTAGLQNTTNPPTTQIQNNTDDPTTAATFQTVQLPLLGWIEQTTTSPPGKDNDQDDNHQHDNRVFDFHTTTEHTTYEDDSSGIHISGSPTSDVENQTVQLPLLGWIEHTTTSPHGQDNDQDDNHQDDNRVFDFTTTTEHTTYDEDDSGGIHISGSFTSNVQNAVAIVADPGRTPGRTRQRSTSLSPSSGSPSESRRSRRRTDEATDRSQSSPPDSRSRSTATGDPSSSQQLLAELRSSMENPLNVRPLNTYRRRGRRPRSELNVGCAICHVAGVSCEDCPFIRVLPLNDENKETAKKLLKYFGSRRTIANLLDKDETRKTASPERRDLFVQILADLVNSFIEHPFLGPYWSRIQIKNKLHEMERLNVGRAAKEVIKDIRDFLGDLEFLVNLEREYGSNERQEDRVQRGVP